MKHILTTSAILLATTFAANADVYDDLAAAQASQAAAEAELVKTQNILAATQDALTLHTDQLTAAYSEIDGLQTNYVELNSDYNNIIESINDVSAKPYKNMGNVFASKKLTDLYEVKNASYDPGASSTNFSLTNGKLTNVTLSGKYHNFSINTDITTSSMSDRVKLETLVHVINDKAYNEGYKDGFNDGFEMGFNEGYQTAVFDIKSAESPL